MPEKMRIGMMYYYEVTDEDLAGVILQLVEKTENKLGFRPNCAVIHPLMPEITSDLGEFCVLREEYIQMNHIWVGEHENN